MTEVIFNPKALVMKDVVCGFKRLSEAEAVGILTIDESLRSELSMPESAKRVSRLGYNPNEKFFFAHDARDKGLVSADFLLLLPNGEAYVGWE